MISHNQLFAIVVITVAVFLVLVSLDGGIVEFGWFREVETTVAVVGVSLAVFNFWGWRWPLLQGWLVRRPHLWGNWKVMIKSGWVDPQTGQPRPPFEATFRIRQTFTTLSLRLESDQSEGELVCSTLQRKEDGGFRLIGTYRNEPGIFERDSSPIHYGTFMLDVEGPLNVPHSLRGHYWTDRATRGEMVAVRAAE